MPFGTDTMSPELNGYCIEDSRGEWKPSSAACSAHKNAAPTRPRRRDGYTVPRTAPPPAELRGYLRGPLSFCSLWREPL